MDNKVEKSIYVRTLLWAYEKQHRGFTKDEMRRALELNEEEWAWIHWMFFNGLGGAAPLIWSIPTEVRTDGRRFGEAYYLSAAGVSAAVDYLELKEAQESGRRGFLLALVAIIISVVVGIAQIYFSSVVSTDQLGNQFKQYPIHY